MAKENKVVETELAPVASPPPAESRYTAQEFAANARSVFGHNPDVVSAALKHAKFESGTIAEARAIIDMFAGRKVQ